MIEFDTRHNAPKIYYFVYGILTDPRIMRKSGLTRGGEFSTENLAFKILRNQSYIDRLYQAQAQAQDRKLSLQ